MRSDLVLWNRSHAPSRREAGPYTPERKALSVRKGSETNSSQIFIPSFIANETLLNLVKKHARCISGRSWEACRLAGRRGRGQHFEGYLTTGGLHPSVENAVSRPPIWHFIFSADIFWGNWRERERNGKTMKGTNTETHATNENEKRVFVLRLGFLN